MANTFDKPASPYAPFYPLFRKIGVGLGVLTVLLVSLFFFFGTGTDCHSLPPSVRCKVDIQSIAIQLIPAL
jgi:hypothetical protein